MRRRELGARVQTSSSPALDHSAPPAIASSSRAEGSREDRDSGGARSSPQGGGMGQCATRGGGEEGVPGRGAGAAVPVLHLPPLRRHARLLAQVQEDLNVPFSSASPSIIILSGLRPPGNILCNCNINLVVMHRPVPLVHISS
ncbi:hypothetical protein PVAP13_9KG316600 [Panicum virgatum]|uniref:Uncharacterized protein n=1 Tax=Panicum virgatum TaxID=38727 RepID=A0A8T0NQE3_PANVG|nr:hypothetical protein PVAP13_9KG316600 [Panicum virgatum]